MTKQKVLPKYIVFDTNIVYDDLLLRGKVVDAIVRYANLTRSIIVVPSIIRMELRKRYEEAWIKEVARLEEVNRKFDGLVDITQHEDAVMRKFDSSWSKFAKRVRLKEVDSKDISLEALIDRSLQEKKPFGAKSKGFRDALIWHSILNFMDSVNDKRTLIFLSNNTDDFGKNGLHEDLANEAKQAGHSICYYTSVGEMVSGEGGAVDYVNDEFVKEEVVPVVSDAITERVNERTDYFDHLMQERIEARESVFEIEMLDMDILEVDTYEYYIYAEDEEFYYLHHDARVLVFGEYRVVMDFEIERGDLVNTLEREMVDTMVTSYVRIDKQDHSVSYVGGNPVGGIDNK